MHRVDKLVTEVEIDGTYLLTKGATYTAGSVGVLWAISKLAEQVLGERTWSVTDQFPI